MPSYFATAATGLLALSGVATAFPQAGFKGFSNSTSNNVSKPVTEGDFCPSKNGGIFQSRYATFSYALECSTTHFGTVIEISFNATIFAPNQKRQVANRPGSIADCLALCDTVDNCVATSFNSAERSCTLFAAPIGAAIAADGIDFAYRVNVDQNTIPAGGNGVSTIYEPRTVTISSCAPTVTNCPLNANAVVTQMVPVTTTNYVCPTAQVAAAAPLACSCAYSASTATVYSTTTAGGQVTVVPVGTAVIAKAMPTATQMAMTSAVMNNANNGANQAGAAMNTGAGAAAATGSMFTGAASNVEAGMGLVAGVAALALML